MSVRFPKVEGPVATALVAGIVPGMAGLLREQQEIEEAAHRLMAVAGGNVGALMSEVDRRAEMFAELQATVARNDRHPRLLALRSVYDDVLAGRL